MTILLDRILGLFESMPNLTNLRIDLVEEDLSSVEERLINTHMSRKEL